MDKPQVIELIKQGYTPLFVEQEISKGRNVDDTSLQLASRWGIADPNSPDWDKILKLVA